MGRRSDTEIRFTVPGAWRDELAAAANIQAISLSDLMRLIVRDFLRNRLDAGDRALLEART